MKAKKAVIIGGTGLIGSKLARLLALKELDVVAAAPNTGVNSVTGQGVAEALAGADILIDVSNAMSFDPGEVRAFFEASGRNLTTAAKAAGVSHYVVLSIVGADRMPDNGYLQGKLAQERLVTASGLPHTIVRSTQFFEFIGSIADFYTTEGTVKLSDSQFQPIAADDVAGFLADVALEPAHNDSIDIGGPVRAPFDRIVDHYLRGRGDIRPVSREPGTDYFGARLEPLSLVPLGSHRIGGIDLDGWLAAQSAIH